jgi:hypothetical protein
LRGYEGAVCDVADDVVVAETHVGLFSGVDEVGTPVPFGGWGMGVLVFDDGEVG